MEMSALADLQVKGERLANWERISKYWQEQPADTYLQVLVQFSMCAYSLITDDHSIPATLSVFSLSRSLPPPVHLLFHPPPGPFPFQYCERAIRHTRSIHLRDTAHCHCLIFFSLAGKIAHRLAQDPDTVAPQL
jgi:hypothetical protein